MDNIPLNNNNNNSNNNLKNSKNAFYLTEETYIKKHSLNTSTRDSNSGNNNENNTKLFFDENSVQSIEGIKK